LIELFYLLTYLDIVILSDFRCCISLVSHLSREHDVVTNCCLCPAEDMTSQNVSSGQDGGGGGLQVAGVNSILPKEHGAKFYTLPVVNNSDKDVRSTHSFVLLQVDMIQLCSLQQPWTLRPEKSELLFDESDVGVLVASDGSK